MKTIFCHYSSSIDVCSPKEKLLNYDGSPCPESLATYVQTAWDDSSLYCKFEGKYDSLVLAPESSTGKTMRLWEKSDVFELFVSPDCNRKYREFQVAPDGKFIDLAIDAEKDERVSDFDWKSGFCNQTVSSSNLWTSILTIPWSAFKGTAPQVNEEWRVNFYRIVSPVAGTKYLAWSPVGKIAFHQPEKFGKLIFQKPV